MSISVFAKDFSKTKDFFNKIREATKLTLLDHYGREGVEALSSATPVSTGITAASWSYKIEKTSTGFNLAFFNSNVHNGVPIATIIQYGHGTGTGGYVQGRDYINPALRPVFDKICAEVRKELSKV